MTDSSQGQTSGDPADYSGSRQTGQQLSGPEREFCDEFRSMIKRFGRQKEVAERVYLSKSALSRYCTGEKLPSIERLDQMCGHLDVSTRERVRLADTLQRAVLAREDRLKNGSAPPGQAPCPGEGPDQGPEDPVDRQARNGRSRSLWTIAVPIAAAAIVLTAGVFAWSSGTGTPASRSTPAPAGVQGSFSGEKTEPVAIPVRSLLPSLAASFREGGTAGAATVTGYELRNAQKHFSLCLTAGGTGKNRDPVGLTPCGRSASQVWIPEQWEINGSAFTHLVSARYQNECLNAQRIHGAMRAGSMTMLWTCYRGNNESWDFGDWYQNVQSGQHSYPILTHTDRLSLDVSNTYGETNAVKLQVQYATPSQFWS